MINNINFGLCCINNTLRTQKNPIYCNRTCIRRTYTVDKAKKLALQNIADMIPILQWNHENGIKNYRMSSDMLPHYTDSETESYTLDFAKSALEDVGKVSALLGQRITAHPGQYVQIGAKDPQVFQKSAEDLTMHSDLMDMMNISREDGILCIHGGGVYGDKESTIRRWVDQFDDLPLGVKERLAIEHCERCYSLVDVMNISDQTGIPVIYDNLHYQCYKDINKTEDIIDDLLPEVVEKWKSRGTNAVMHIAQQKIGSRIGAHADYVDNIPDEIKKIIAEDYDIEIDIEVEAKAKELAILKLISKLN